MSANAPAGLTYVSDDMPGISRRRSGKGFAYRDGRGVVRDKRTLERIRSLAIPPAWTDVWISASENGHLQATGRDARGRKQHRYHPKFREHQEAAKFDRLTDFAKTLPDIRRTIDGHMRKQGLPREKVLAAIVHLLDTTLIRVGNDEYARNNKSYGLTTLKDKHAEVSGDRLRFVFTGKSGKSWRLTTTDRRVAKIVRAVQDLPGQRLFQYEDENGAPQSVTSTDVNAYLREISGSDISAKEFRTWGGAVLAAAALNVFDKPGAKALAKANIKAAIDDVAGSLGNTPTICRKCYVHPALIETYLAGEFDLGRAKRAGLSAHEAAVLAFLDRRRPRRQTGKSQEPRSPRTKMPARAPAVQEVTAS
jgi:DNA topoisomerase-1